MHGVAISDLIRSVPEAVNTICLSKAASTACYILAGGERSKRVAVPSAWRQ